MENLLELCHDLEKYLNENAELSSSYITLSNHLLLTKLNLLETNKVIFRLVQDNLKSLRLLKESDLDPEDKCYHEFVVSNYNLEASLLKQKQIDLESTVTLIESFVKTLEDRGCCANDIFKSLTTKVENLILGNTYALPDQAS